MKKENKNNKPIIGISIGDVNGIGPEIIIKALDYQKILQQFTPIIYGSAKVLSFYRKQLNRNHFNFSPIKSLYHHYERKVNVINCWAEMIDIQPGQSNETGGKYAFKALEVATKDLVDGKIDGLVTAPINKLNIQNEHFKFAGHTEYFAKKAGLNQCLMFMVSDTLRIGMVTNHIPLQQVSASITQECIIQKINIMQLSLQNDFGIVKPKIAVLGLNPHAGENGFLGKEEINIIKPAIESYKAKGQLVIGPFPADGFFGSSEYRKYDGVLAMYHDQGLIAFKSLSFSNGVNFTAGLPFVRTSPDHGTAYAIAGKNKANESSFRTALYAAIDIANARKENAYNIKS